MGESRVVGKFNGKDVYFDGINHYIKSNNMNFVIEYKDIK